MLDDAHAILIGSFLARMNRWCKDWLEKAFNVIAILVHFTIVDEVWNLKDNQVIIIEILLGLVLVGTE